MDGIVPLGVEEREVTLPDVVWGWHDATGSGGPQEASVLELLGRASLVLPVVSQPPSPSQDPGESPPRRKRSAVASFFQGLKGGGGGTVPPPQTSVAESTPPILAALESVSTSSKRPDDGGSRPLADHRDVSTFRFGVDAASAVHMHASPSPSPPKHSPDGRPRHRVQSISGSIAPLDLRTDPVGGASPDDSPTKTHSRHRRSTKTSIQRHSLLAAVGPSTAYTQAVPSTNGDHEDEDALDLTPDLKTSIGTRLHSLLDASEVATSASDPDPDFQHPVNAQCKTPRNLPPLATSPGKPPNNTTSSSPRKLRQSQSAKDVTDLNGAADLPVCAACGKRVYPTNVSLALDAAHVVHRACFRCVACLEPLTLANFHRISTGVDGARFVCTTHYVERLEAKQQNPDLHFSPDVKISYQS